MANYDFSTLSSSDLEDLFCDLLNAEQTVGSGIVYRTFKDGKDKGIDLLYTTPASQYAHVGQVKHYYRTGYNGLLSHLKGTEAAKVHKLAPDQYILATSVDLSVAQAQAIQKVFAPYCRSLSDVYGKADLNRLIEKYDDVLRRHFKLWFSDTTVLEMILRSNLTYRSAEFIEGELTKRLRLFVPTPALMKARKSLDEQHFIIITGEPGVGKTTMAEMLSYDYISMGYKFLFINDDIRDAERFLDNDDSRQLIYFDDFLGSNAAEINRSQGSESTLVNIISRIKRNPNKRLILTTRTHIFSSVLTESERLSRSGLRAGETVLTLKEYDLQMKRQLLENHIDESVIDDAYKSVLRDPSMIDFIIHHRSFNPRSVEFITSNANLDGIGVGQFETFIRSNFNEPEQIWRHAYLHQIGDNERLVLNTLLSFDASVDFGDLEKAFDQRIKTDVKAQQTREINAFKRAIKRLDRGFIILRNERVNFINPSLKDFLTNYIKTDQHEIAAIVQATRFIQQHSPLIERLCDRYGIELPEGIKIDMMRNFPKYLRWRSRDQDLMRLLIFVNDEVERPDKNNFLEDMVEEVHNWEELFRDNKLNKEFRKFLEIIRENHLLKRAFDTRISSLVDGVIAGAYDAFQAVGLLEDLAKTLEIDFREYDTRIINANLVELFEAYISSEAATLSNDITNPDDAMDLIQEVSDLVDQVTGLGINLEVDVSELYQDWESIARENEFRQQNKKEEDDWDDH